MKKIIISILMLFFVVGCSNNIKQNNIIICSSESTLKFDEDCLKEMSNSKCKIFLGSLYDSSKIMCGDPTYPVWRCVATDKTITRSFLFSNLQLEQCLLK